ncbi:unnamed protein product [Lasius platythorax]|uniref:Uncharacterized protein n=1 Tax=Lasius platythorax TaxID=488582 RepID=A0AAV2NU40_9HYME
MIQDKDTETAETTEKIVKEFPTTVISEQFPKTDNINVELMLNVLFVLMEMSLLIRMYVISATKAFMPLMLALRQLEKKDMDRNAFAKNVKQIINNKVMQIKY